MVSTRRGTMKGCSFDGCDQKHFAKGLCHGHYTQKWKGQELTPLRQRNVGKGCSFPGCKSEADTKGLCSIHYHQGLRGDPLTRIHHRLSPNEVRIVGNVAWIVLTDRKGDEVTRTQIDLEDLVRVPLVPRWYFTSKAGGYAAKGTAGERNLILLHRLIAATPDDLETDHINGDRLDNRKANLRNVTRAKNTQNIAHKGRESLRNIHWKESHGAYEVYVDVDHVRHWVGYFKSLSEAKAAAKVARQGLMSHANEARHQ
jgi:hypothetical protein